MREVFGDTGYWMAMHDPGDELHRKAREATGQLYDYRIVTSELVIVEFLNGVSRFGRESRICAVNTVRRLYTAQDVVVVTLQDMALTAAVERYASRLDQRWSLIDCHSFLVMEERSITDALAYDRDFEQAGFRALLREY